jgi:ferredoxin
MSAPPAVRIHGAAYRRGCFVGIRPVALRYEPGRQSVRVRVDAEKCQGHNRCYAIAPELFDVDEYGNAHELNDGAVPTELEDKARTAVANCPEYAISISE